jgi:hypothetical protein
MPYIPPPTFPLTSDVSAGSHKIGNLADPSSAQDAVTKAYGDANYGGGGGGSGVLLAVNVGGSSNVTTSSTSLVDLSTDAVTFTVPASGNVVIELSGIVQPDTSHTPGTQYSWGLREATTNLRATIVATQSGAGTEYSFITLRYYFTGLTPGASLTYKWAHKVSAGTGQTIGGTGTSGEERIMTVYDTGAGGGAGTGLSDPTTTRGDLLARDSTVVTRLGIGAAGKFLRSDGTDPSWQSIAESDVTNLTTDLAAKLADPMTTRGDVIVRNASNVTARLGIGAAGKILSSDGTDASWGNGPLTTQDDLIVGGASGLPTRLAKGADGQVLTVDPVTHHLVWANAASGFTNPMTTKGDVIVGDTGGTAIRKAVGTDGQVLTADAASTGGIKWAAGGGGGGAAADTGGTYFRHPLDRASLDGTYGDEFDGAALNGRWTRSTQTSGEETYQQGPRASALRVAYSTGAASRYIYQTAPNGTNETWETSLTVWQPTTTGQMFALLMLDTSGNGVAAMLYDNTTGLYLANVASHAYTSLLTTVAYPVAEHRVGHRYWLRLRKASGVYSASYSFDGENYSPEATGTPTAFTPARVGIGRIFGTQSGDTADWHWFDKTA